jgi:hypothetical protein
MTKLPPCMAPSGECQYHPMHEELLASRKLSFEWMRKHDKLLAFIQARPAMLRELIARDADALDP